jgi:hypothetical protein
MRHQKLRRSIIFISLLSFFCVMGWTAHRRATAQQKVIIDNNSALTVANAVNHIEGLKANGAVATAPALTGIFFTSTMLATGTQTIIVSGSSFQAGLTLAVTPITPPGDPSTFSGSQIQSQTGTSFQVTVTFATAGNYSFQVTNPSGDQSNRLFATVQTPATSWWTPEGVRLTDVTAGFPGKPFADVAAFPLRDGRWRLLFDAGGAMRSAVSPDGISLTVESGLPFQTVTSLRPSLVKILKLDSGQIRAYFSSSNMYSAISSDEGLTFTLEAGVRLAASAVGESTITGGSVVRNRDGGWRMYFGGEARVFSATSTDLLTWTPDAGVRVGPGASLGGNPAVHPDAILNAAGSVSLFFFHGPSPANPMTAGLGDKGGMYVSTSTDGLTFTAEAFTGIYFGNDATVVPLPGGGYRMYYNWGDNFGGTIYSATGTDPTATTVQFSASNYTVGEGDGRATLTVTRAGDASAASTVDYATSDTAGTNNCNMTIGAASSRCDYLTTIGTLHFSPGDTTKTISIPIIDDSYFEGPETFNVTLSNASGATLDSPSATTVIINDNDSANGTNPIDRPDFFVTEHYYDFLSRQPDAGGLAFWTNEITSCGSDAQCVSAKRINVSAAYFLSTEFQQTGYLVERMYKSAYGSASRTSTFGGSHQIAVPIVRFSEFLSDTQEIGSGVVVGQAGWEMALENNKQAFTLEFVQRARFITAFPTSMPPSAFVDKLFENAGVTPATSDRTAAINEFASASMTADVAARSRALRDVAENPTLNSQEFNRAFVLMQFLGYLRRNPNDAPDADYTGYDFWLTKLNQFNGNYVTAEMVKAFIVSGEYRQRFGL